MKKIELHGNIIIKNEEVYVRITQNKVKESPTFDQFAVALYDDQTNKLVCEMVKHFPEFNAAVNFAYECIK